MVRLGNYSSRELSEYAKYNGFNALLNEAIVQCEISGETLRNCLERERTIEEHVVQICELFGCEADVARRLRHELVNDFEDCPFDRSSATHASALSDDDDDVPVTIGVPMENETARNYRSSDTVGGNLMNETKDSRYPSWYDTSRHNDRWRKGYDGYDYDDNDSYESRERTLNERERAIEEREKRMDAIEERLKRLEEEKR